MRYDKKSILEYADCLEIADMLGIEKNVRGNKVYIACPEHIKNTGRRESKIDNCILSEKGYYCFSCLAKGNAISLVMNYLDVDEEEACRTISIMLGDELMFVKGEDNTTVRFPFSKEELTSIGLISGVTIEHPCYGSLNKPYMPEGYKMSRKVYGNDYTVVKTEYYSILDLMKEDPEGFTYMLQGKLCEAQAENHFIMDSGLLDLLNQTFEIPYYIYKEKVRVRKDLRILKQLENKINYYILQNQKPA